MSTPCYSLKLLQNSWIVLDFSESALYNKVRKKQRRQSENHEKEENRSSCTLDSF